MLLATVGPLSEKDFTSLQSLPGKCQSTSSLEIIGKHDYRTKVAFPPGYFWPGLAGLDPK